MYQCYTVLLAFIHNFFLLVFSYCILMVQTGPMEQACSRYHFSTRLNKRRGQIVGLQRQWMNCHQTLPASWIFICRSFSNKGELSSHSTSFVQPQDTVNSWLCQTVLSIHPFNDVLRNVLGKFFIIDYTDDVLITYFLFLLSANRDTKKDYLEIQILNELYDSDIKSIVYSIRRTGKRFPLLGSCQKCKMVSNSNQIYNDFLSLWWKTRAGLLFQHKELDERS